MTTPSTQPTTTQRELDNSKPLGDSGTGASGGGSGGNLPGGAATGGDARARGEAGRRAAAIKRES